MTPEAFAPVHPRRHRALDRGWRANARSTSTPDTTESTPPWPAIPRSPPTRNAPPITQALARFVATHPSRGWSDAVEHEAHRTLLNWLGCAVGAAQHEAVDAALAAVQMLQPAPQASVLGRAERVDMASAALVNGISSHTFDFDDTHLKTIIHPAGPVASALLALAEHTGASGRALIDALVLGIDVSCRIGNVVYPEHYDRGWHITGSTGMLGAAAGCARLLGLDEQRTTMALGIAASQPVGLREQFGTMTKPLHPGAAARAGLMAALMARHGYTASPRALEAPRGLVQVVSTKCDWNEATDELGERFEISFNTYKPFACGIVIHPSIDACVQLREQGVRAEQSSASNCKRAFAGARTHRQEGARRRPGRQVQRLPRLRRRPAVRPRRRGRVRRRDRHARRRGGAAAQGGGHGRRRHRRGIGRRRGACCAMAGACMCSSSTPIGSLQRPMSDARARRPSSTRSGRPACSVRPRSGRADRGLLVPRRRPDLQRVTRLACP